MTKGNIKNRFFKKSPAKEVVIATGMEGGGGGGESESQLW